MLPVLREQPRLQAQKTVIFSFQFLLSRHVCLFVFIEKKYLSIKTLAYPRFTVTPVVLWAQTPMGLHRFPWESILIAYCSRQEVVTRLRNHHVIAHAYIIQEKQFFQFSLVNVLEELLQRHTEDYSLANTSQSKTHPKARLLADLPVSSESSL